MIYYRSLAGLSNYFGLDDEETRREEGKRGLHKEARVPSRPDFGFPDNALVPYSMF